MASGFSGLPQPTQYGAISVLLMMFLDFQTMPAHERFHHTVVRTAEMQSGAELPKSHDNVKAYAPGSN